MSSKAAAASLKAFLFFALFSLPGPAQDSTKITYDGYRTIPQQIWFNSEKEADGKFRFQLSDTEGSWQDVHTGSHFLCFSVRLEENGYWTVAYLREHRFPYDPEVRVAQAEPADVEIERGLFGISGQPAITAYEGDTFSIGQDSVTVRGLSRDSAILYFESEKAEVNIPLSAVGSLRSEVEKLEGRLRSERRMNAKALGETEIENYCFILLFAYVPVFGFILVGMLTLPPFIVGHSRRRSASCVRSPLPLL